MISPEQERDAKASLKPFVLSVAETARLLGCGESTVWEKLARGQLIAVKDGCRTKILMSSIERHAASWPRAQFQPFKPRARTARRRPI